MKICNNSTMKNAQIAHSASRLHTLHDCYAKPSEAKEQAYYYCLELFNIYNGYNFKITGYNTNVFSAAFYGEYEGKKAFFYITRDYDRVMILE